MKTFNLIKFSLFLCIPSPHSIVTNYSTFSHTHRGKAAKQLPPEPMSWLLFRLLGGNMYTALPSTSYPQGLSSSLQNLQSQPSQSEGLLPHSDTSVKSSLGMAPYPLLLPKLSYQCLCFKFGTKMFQYQSSSSITKVFLINI